MNHIGAVELMIVALGGLALLAMFGGTLWGIVDAASRPVSQWEAAGQGKVLWIALMAGGLLACAPAGLVLAISYFASIRPKLVAALDRSKLASHGFHDEL